MILYEEQIDFLNFDTELFMIEELSEGVAKTAWEAIKKFFKEILPNFITSLKGKIKEVIYGKSVEIQEALKQLRPLLANNTVEIESSYVSNTHNITQLMADLVVINLNTLNYSRFVTNSTTADQKSIDGLNGIANRWAEYGKDGEKGKLEYWIESNKGRKKKKYDASKLNNIENSYNTFKSSMDKANDSISKLEKEINGIASKIDAMSSKNDDKLLEGLKAYQKCLIIRINMERLMYTIEQREISYISAELNALLRKANKGSKQSEGDK